MSVNKSVSGINAEFADATDQLRLNRFVTAAEWDVDELNDQRLQWLQEDPVICYSERGGIAIDDVLIDHDGKLIEDVGWFWNHAEQRHKIAATSGVEGAAMSPLVGVNANNSPAATAAPQLTVA